MNSTTAHYPFETVFGPVFSRHGWTLRHADFMGTWFKEYQTAVGIRVAYISVRPFIDRAAGKARFYVTAEYTSEGLNVLDTLQRCLEPEELKTFESVFEALLPKAEARILDTYAIRLLAA